MKFKKTGLFSADSLTALFQAGFFALFPSWQIKESAWAQTLPFLRSGSITGKAAFLFILFLFFLLLFLLLRKHLLLPLFVWVSGKTNTDQQVRLSSALLLIGIIVIFIVNIVFPCIDTTSWTFSVPELFPTMKTIGYDYKVAFYDHAKALVDSNFQEVYPDNYPLFHHLFAVPWLIFSPITGYIIFTILNILMYLAIFLMLISMSKEIIAERFPAGTGRFHFFFLLFLAAAMALYVFPSYPFLFYFERGQSDILTFFFAILGLFLVSKCPDKVWLQVICISISAQLKIYTGLFFLPLLFKHKHKSIIPIIVVNIIMLFCLGPKLLMDLVNYLVCKSDARIENNPSDWAGNHCILSFIKGFIFSPQLTQILWIGIGVIVAAIWAFLTYKIYVSGINSTEKILWYVMVSSPLMNLIPTISHDYRLMILFPSFFIYLTFLFARLMQKKDAVSLMSLVITLGIMLYLSRSYVLQNVLLPETDTFFWRNKFLWVFFTQILFSVEFLRIGQNKETEEAAV